MIKQPHWMHPPHQGLLDIQLSIPNTQLDLESPLLNAIAKRDKRVEPFDSDKVIASIFKAAKSIGVEDEALSRSLATSVTLFLIQQTRMKGLNVSHVAEAIKRVLVEMGYERIALAYEQYRQQQDQHEQLWKGDSSSEIGPLSNWQWHRKQSLAIVSPEECIAAECERCALPKSHRAVIEETVMGHLATLSMEQPSYALVLELTRQVIRNDATLTIDPDEQSFELDVSATEHALSGVYSLRDLHMNPASTDRALASYVKETYALHSVYSQDLAYAHQRGELHIHALGQLDRLHSIALYPDMVKSVGSLARVQDNPVTPARKIEALVEDIISSTRYLHGYCSQSLKWEAVNYTLAPYLVEFDEAALREVSESLIHGLSALHSEQPLGVTKMGIAWNVPHDLQGIEAIGPNGAYTGKSYEHYASTAQDFARVLIQVFQENAGVYTPGCMPVPVVTVPTEVSDDTATAEFMFHVARTVLVLEASEVRGGSSPLMLPFVEETLRVNEIVGQCVTINLPRVVFALANGGNFWSELDRLFEHASSIIAEKHYFLNTLAARKKNGPYGLFSFQHNGVSMADLDSVVYGVDCCGVYECIALLQENMSEENEATEEDWVAAIFSHLEKRCAEWSDLTGVLIRLLPAHDTTISQRLARLDLEHENELAKHLLDESHVPEYSIHLDPVSSGCADVQAFEQALKRVKAHGDWYQGSTVALTCPPADTTFPEQLNQSLNEFFREQSGVGLAFTNKRL